MLITTNEKTMNPISIDNTLEIPEVSLLGKNTESKNSNSVPVEENEVLATSVRPAHAIPKEETKNVTNTHIKASSASIKHNKKKHSQRPGRLLGSLPFEIHTLDAQFLFDGYIRKECQGVLQFGGQMTMIWNAAALDDPYADWYLLRVYDGLKTLGNELVKVTKLYQQIMQESCRHTHMQLMPFVSQKPVIKPLWFRTQYGYLAANLIADFDMLVRTVLTANRVGILLDKPINEIKEQWVDMIVNLLKLPFDYQELHITRDDVLRNNAIAKKARILFGKMPRNVLNKELRSPFSPHIKSSENTGTVNVEANEATLE